MKIPVRAYPLMLLPSIREVLSLIRLAISIALSKFSVAEKFSDNSTRQCFPKILNENPNKKHIQKSAQKKEGTIAILCANAGPDLRERIEFFCERNKSGLSFDVSA